MARRNLAKELLRGLKEILAWKRGKLKLKTTKTPKGRHRLGNEPRFLKRVEQARTSIRAGRGRQTRRRKVDAAL